MSRWGEGFRCAVKNFTGGIKIASFRLAFCLVTHCILSPKGLSWLYKALPWLSHVEDRCGSTSLIKMFVLRGDQKTEPWQRLKRRYRKRSVYQIVQHWRDKWTFELISLHNVISYMKLDCQIQFYKMQGESKRAKRRMNTQGTNHCHSQRSAWQTKN